MFSKLFKKEPEKSEWVAWMRLIESKPASISIDCLAHNDRTSKLHALVILSIKDLGTERNGFPSKEKFDELYLLEDKITEIADKNKSKYPGRFITDGKAYYFIYTNKSEAIESKLKDLMYKTKKYSFYVDVREGKDWQDYYQMLYPPLTEKQKYHNSTLINRIIQEGDKPEKERLIDQAIFFDNKENRESFLRELQKIKFPIEKHELSDNGGNIYELQISVRSPLNIELLNSSTDKLIKLAEKHNAQYDGWGSEIAR